MFQISEVLRKVPFFQTLGKDGIDFIVERLKFKPFESNDAICHAGDPGDKMYIIISGTVKVVIRATPDAEEQIIAHLISGDYFGEMSLLTGEPRSASVITTEPAEMFILHKSDFDVIIERFPSITLSMGKIMSQRLRDTLQKAAKAGSGDMTQSVQGDLSEKPLVEVLRFCESNSLNGQVTVSHKSDIGRFFYEKGELQKVELDGLAEDQALDTMLNWQSGQFVIEPRKISIDEIKAEQAKKSAEKIVRRIIIVNNSMVVQRMLQRAFDSMGYEVYAVENADKAIKMARSMDPHLIISDTKLPDADGVDLFNSVRDFSSIPFVLLTEKNSKSQFMDRAQDKNSIHFTNSHEIGEIVKVVEGIFVSA